MLEVDRGSSEPRGVGDQLDDSVGNYKAQLRKGDARATSTVVIGVVLTLALTERRGTVYSECWCLLTLWESPPYLTALGGLG